MEDIVPLINKGMYNQIANVDLITRFLLDVLEDFLHWVTLSFDKTKV